MGCPLCRTLLRHLAGEKGGRYRCAAGHEFSPLGLLWEQSKRSVQLLRNVESSIQAHLAVSGELASHAQLEGQAHLLQYLERSIDVGRDTLETVQDGLREEGEPVE